MPCFDIDLYGAPGTAKSTATKMLRRLLDPQPGVTQSLNEHNVDDLGLTCVMQWIPCFENISRLEPEVQDVLCALTTDLAAKSRKLYTDGGAAKAHLQAACAVVGFGTPAACKADKALRPWLNNAKQHSYALLCPRPMAGCRRPPPRNGELLRRHP